MVIEDEGGRAGKARKKRAERYAKASPVHETENAEVHDAVAEFSTMDPIRLIKCLNRTIQTHHEMRQ